MGYLIFQTLILLLTAFVVGCIIGCWLKRVFGSTDANADTQLQSVAAEPAPVVVADTSAADGRPAMLTAPRGGAKDNLKRVKGIGPVNEGRLNELGIYHFDQIAAWGDGEIAWVDDYLSFKDRIERENWVSQARILSEGGDTGFSNRVDKGQVSSSSGKAVKPKNMKKS